MPVSTTPCRPRLGPGKVSGKYDVGRRWRMHVGLHGRLGGRTPTQSTEGIVSQQLVAIVSTDGVRNAGGTTWSGVRIPVAPPNGAIAQQDRAMFPQLLSPHPHQK